MNAALADCWTTGSVEWDDYGDRPRVLAVRALVVSERVVDPVVAMGVHLCDAGHSVGSEVLASLTHCLG